MHVEPRRSDRRVVARPPRRATAEAVRRQPAFRRRIGPITGALLTFILLLTGLLAAPVRAATGTLYATGVTTPAGGLWLPATTAGHEWVADAANGFCRLDGPAADGTFAIAITTCNRAASALGQPTYDSRVNADGTHYLYLPDGSAKTSGIIRLVFAPTFDGGNGAISIFGQTALAPNLGLQTIRPTATALGPDGTLYVGNATSGNIQRVINPNGAISAQSVVKIGNTTARAVTQLAFVGPDLWMVDANGVEVIPNAASCSGNCLAAAAPGLAGVAGPLSIASDAAGIYVGTASTIYLFASGTATLSIFATQGVLPSGQATPMKNITALNLDPSGSLYAGDDPTGGTFSLQGRVWLIARNSLPGAPTDVMATRGDAQATVTWTAPLSSGSSPITSYTVTSSPAGGTVTVTAPAGSTTVPTSATVTGLANGTAYTFTVAVTNAVGTGPASAPSNSVTPAAPPGAPSAVTAVGGNAQATVSWTAPASDGGAAIAGYTITANPGGGATTVAAPATSGIVTGLANGTAYTFTVTATNVAGAGPASIPSNSVTPRTVPDAPTAVTATPGDSQATVIWTAPASDGGSPITGYTIISNPAGGSATVAAPATTATVTGLTNGTSYTFTILATNAAGTGLASAPSNSVTPAAPPPASTAPGAPTGVTATGGILQAVVTWIPPVSNGGSPITGYTVTSSPAGGMVNVAAPATSATVTGLVAGTTYTFAVMASNAVGISAASALSNSVTPTAPPSPTDVQITGFPSNGGPAVGSVFTYTWQVKNNGSAVANGVTLADTLPSGLTFVSVASSVGTCTDLPSGAAGGVITCALGSLPVGVQVNVVITVRAPVAPQTIANTGTAAFNGADTKLQNNTFTVTVGVR